MAHNRLLVTGFVGFVVSMLGCLTPVLVLMLAAIGISGSMGWLHYVLLVAMAIFAALIVYAVINNKRRGRVSIPTNG
jgi:mercuric ion transport protein